MHRQPFYCFYSNVLSTLDKSNHAICYIYILSCKQVSRMSRSSVVQIIAEYF